MRMIDADKLITRLMDAELDQMQSKTGEELCQIVESMATVEQTEDAISRQAAIDAFSMFAEYESNRTNAEWVNRTRIVLSNLPSVTPKQKTGHWIECEDEVKCFCSECKEISDYPTKFCPNCGANMEVQE